MPASANLELLRGIATAIEDRVESLPPRRYGEETGTGADGTMTKRVDAVAEEVILEKVQEAPEPLDVLSEEAGYIDNGGDKLLVTDPIDGTTNAIHGLPLYSVSLAIGEDNLGGITTALVHNIPTGQTYEAEKGEGAQLDGSPIQAQPFEPAWAMVSSAVSREPTPETLTRALKQGELNDFRHLGSAALEMCFVGHGALDVYYHPEQRLRVTDIAAGTLIVREAGGHALTPHGDQLEMPLDLTRRASVLTVGDLEALEAVEVLS